MSRVGAKKFLVIALVLLTRTISHADSNPLYLDPSQPIDKRVDDLISRMTLMKKPQSWITSAGNSSPANSAMGRMESMPARHLVQIADDDGVSSVDRDGRYLGSRFSSRGNGCDLRRRACDVQHPRSRPIDTVRAGLPRAGDQHQPESALGRIQECYGEDPYLTGRLGLAYVKGLQGDDPKYLKLAATLKHYAVNNVETKRLSLSATVSERMLYDIGCRTFAIASLKGMSLP